ncbi:MAG: hypothetical protein L0K73_13040, partial [Corynebacterium variabile]
DGDCTRHILIPDEKSRIHGTRGRGKSINTAKHQSVDEQQREQWNVQMEKEEERQVLKDRSRGCESQYQTLTNPISESTAQKHKDNGRKRRE